MSTAALDEKNSCWKLNSQPRCLASQHFGRRRRRQREDTWHIEKWGKESQNKAYSLGPDGSTGSSVWVSRCCNSNKVTSRQTVSHRWVGWCNSIGLRYVCCSMQIAFPEILCEPIHSETPGFTNWAQLSFRRLVLICIWLSCQLTWIQCEINKTFHRVIGFRFKVRWKMDQIPFTLLTFCKCN